MGGVSEDVWTRPPWISVMRRRERNQFEVAAMADRGSKVLDPDLDRAIKTVAYQSGNPLAKLREWMSQGIWSEDARMIRANWRGYRAARS